MVEAAEPPQPNFGPHYPWFRVIDRSRRSRHDQVDYWEGSLQLLYHKFSLTMIDHGSRRTLGPGPSRFRLQIQKHDPLPLKQDCPTTVCFIKFLPTCTVEAVDGPQILYRASLVPGLGSCLGGLYLTKFTTGKVHCNFCILNFP
jgi:hypothetical protein